MLRVARSIERKKKNISTEKKELKKKRKNERENGEKIRRKSRSFAVRKNLCVATECINDEPAMSRPETHSPRTFRSEHICLELLQSALLLLSNGREYE